MGSEKLLILRSKSIGFFKMYEKWIVAIGKYLCVMGMLQLINSHLGYVEILTRSSFVVGLGLLSMALSSKAIVMLMMSVVAIHLLSYNIVVGSLVAGVFLVIYIGYIRLYPKESIWIVLTMVAFAIRCDYLVPLLAGLFSGYASITAIALGIVGVYSSKLLSAIIQNTVLEVDFLASMEQIIEMFLTTVVFNADMLSLIIIFSVVFTTVYFISKQSIDYAPYIAATIGGVMNLLGFGLGILFLQLDMSVAQLVLTTTLSVLVSVGVQLFVAPLDYSRVETVKFEDEENVYYVKIVPKIGLHIEPKKIEQVYTENTVEEKEML